MLGVRAAEVRLAFVDPADPTLRGVEAAAASAGYSVVSRPLPSPPYVRIDGTWESWESRLDPDMRRELRRRRRRLEERGSVEIEVHDGGERLDELLDEGFDVEGAGWKDRSGTAIRSGPETERFYRSIARWGVDEGMLHLAFLRVDGRAIAFDFSLETPRAHFLLKTGFDPEWGRYGPGRLLRREMLARAFSLGLETYEFLGAAEPWKLEWTTTRRERVEIAAFPRTPIGVASRAVEERVLPALRGARDRLRPRRDR